MSDAALVCALRARTHRSYTRAAVPRLYKQIIAWCVVYMAALALPLLLAAWRYGDDRRGFWVEFGVALGLVGLAMMGLQFALTARFRWLPLPFAVDSILQFHRQAGIVAFVFVVAHPIILVIANPEYLEFFDPRVNAPRAIALVVAMVALVLLVGLSIWRERVGLSYEWWRLTHGGLAALVLFIGVVHAVQVSHYLSPTWKKLIWIALTGVAIYLLIHVRVTRPLRMRRKPWRITEVRAEPGDVWTVHLAADGHGGMRHRPGQFVWLTVNETPWSLQQHPFSIASCEPDPCRLALTIKELGDFTSTLGTIPPGTRAFLEGPYGGFTLDERFNGDLVFIVGGIGVTPVMSILRSLRHAASRRRLLMIYGNTTFDTVVFQDELEEMERQMNLKVIHVIEDAPEQWQGEVGYITAEVLDKHLGRDRLDELHFYICGPDTMMDIAEQTLMKRGAPLSSIYVERFKMV